ncbi:receptor-like protein EIX2 [Rutidosis leptorrhynchoides]|uniref:receptor-like protein EIX2 n=1 Tax=Rutidosis leptorrhynchoides TaxID=125765 RepID=UPI003A98D9E0
MRVGLQHSHNHSFYFFILVVALFHSCLSDDTNSNTRLCIDDERRALLEFKHGLIDDADRLASWHSVDKDCCKWAGIVCDNVTGHILQIHLPGVDGHCHDDYDTQQQYDEISKQRLRGDLSPSLLQLKQLRHLDLSCNDFGGIQVPSFIGSIRNLRYLNLSCSEFGGTIPPQLGNLTEMRILSLGSFYSTPDDIESTSIGNMQWLSSLTWLRHLDTSGVDLSKADDWFQVINTLPYLVQLHFSTCQLLHIHPLVYSLNLTFLSVLDLSRNQFTDSFMSKWIFSVTSLVSLDLTSCGFHDHMPNSINNFRNLTSLKFLQVSGNTFMNSSLILEGLSSVGSNLILLDMSYCGVSSSTIGSLHNLTSLLNLGLSGSQITNTIPKSLGNLCNLKHLDLADSSFFNISIKAILESFFECKSPSLESLSFESASISSNLPNQLGQLMNLVDIQFGNSRIVGIIPDSIGQLYHLKSLDLDENLISGPIPYSIGALVSLEFLDLSNNQLNGSLPASLGQLSKLVDLDISNNLLQGVVTEAHFSKLTKLKYLSGIGNNLTFRPDLANWIPPFKLYNLYISSWDIGPQFPKWLLSQGDLTLLELKNTGISSTMPLSFWTSLPNLEYLDMSQNQIRGWLYDIPATLVVVDLSSNRFSGKLPNLFNNSLLMILNLSNNSFTGSLHHLLCSYGGNWLDALHLANNHLSGVVPECWAKWPNISYINLENNNLGGGIPKTMGSLSSLGSLNMCNNKLSGRLPATFKNLAKLEILQLAGNELVGKIPTWVGTHLSSLRILNLQSNNFNANIPHELCYITSIQILYLAYNRLSGDIPRCFNNFTILSEKETITNGQIEFIDVDNMNIVGSASLVTKGQEYTYSTILGFVTSLDLSSNNLSGSIPSELMVLHALQSLNLSRNQLTGKIPENIGDLKSLESFDVSLNHLYGELPVSLSRLSFLSNFNVSVNNLTGRIPSSTQLQGFGESSFFGNKLCGVPLTRQCGEVASSGHREDSDESHERDWGLIISILCGFVIGFWIVVTPSMVGRIRRAYFHFMRYISFGSITL